MKYCFTLLLALAFTVGVGCGKDEGGSTPADTPSKSTTDSKTDGTGGDAMKQGGDALKDAPVTYQCSCGKEATQAGDLPPPS